MTKRKEKQPTPSESICPPEPSLSSCYGSIDELPLTVFIDCLTRKDYAGLIREGEPTADELSRTWLHLYSEFHERIGDVHMETLLDRTKLIDTLASRLQRLTMLLSVASVITDSEEIAAAFKEEGFTLDVNADEETYQQQLRVINARLKPDSMRLDRLRSEMSAADEHKAATREHFTTTLMDISKHEGFRIRTEDVTTGEYCTYLRRLREHIEAVRFAQSKN